MSKSTKYFDLFSALKAGADKGVSPESLQKTLGFTQGALAVYIHALRHKFGAIVESVRNGRTVVAYKLTNIEAMEKVITAARKPRTASVTKAPKKVLASKVIKPVKKTVVQKVSDGSIPVPDADLDVDLSDADLADIRHQLGV